MSERHFSEGRTAARAGEAATRSAIEAVRPPAQRSAVHDLQSAAAEGARALDPAVRERLQGGLGRDFSGVRVHSGPESARAAERMGARAYTLGNDIHLGGEAQSMSGGERSRLLTHEAVHTVQQGGGRVAPHAGLGVSSPGDAAEREAERIAETLPVAPSRSLALRDRLRGGPLAVARRVAPQLQRDLTDKYPVSQGEFKLGLKTESHPGAKSGMSGTIKFKANDKAPDSTNIRMLQVLRLEDLSTGKDYVWTGGDAGRNKVMTAADKNNGIAAGWHVDHDPSKAAPRTKAGDADVSPYYRDYWPNKTSSQDGSKQGKTISEASLWDYPGWSQKCRYTFETLAKATDTGHVFGTVLWGFTISDGAKGTVEKEHASGREVTLANTDKAIEKFNQFYRNKGASTAP
jgi:hypothetical protein